METPPIPKKPRFISQDGHWEIIPNVEIFRVSEVTPETYDEVKKAEKLGPVMQILYCQKTYSTAIARAKEMVEAEGVLPERIRWVMATRDTVAAILGRKWTIKPLTPTEGGSD